MKGIRVTKIFREISFQGVLGKLQQKSCLQRQSFIRGICETNSSFRVRWRTAGRV